MEKKLNIVMVLRSGGRYSVEDVRLLAFHLEKWRGDQEIAIHCIYDKIKCKSTFFGIRFLPMPYDWKHWWAKMNLFAPEFRDLKPFLYLDLDTVIIGEYVKVIELKQDNFTMLQDFYNKKVSASGMMWIPEKQLLHNLWADWMADPAMHISHYRGDGEFIRAHIGHDQWNTDQIITMKPPPRCKPLPYKPKDKAVVCFHGKPSIFEAVKDIQWIKDYVMEFENEK